MNPWLAILAVLGVLGVLLGGLRILQGTGRLSPEWVRKLVHIGMGLVCLCFPWIFKEIWPVVVLAGLAVIGLAGIRFLPALSKRFGSVLGGVQRDSLGEFYFPIGVATVFWLAHGDWLLYVIPVLTLTIADSVGALVGIRYGLSKYQTEEGFKSAEGSVAFFAAAFLSCHVPLLLYGNLGRAETLLIGLTIGLIVMLLEAISWRGQDNLIIPIGTYLLLRTYVALDVPDLVARFLVMIGLVLVTLIWRKRAAFTDSAVLAAALAGYAVWALGGWLWLAAPLLLFGVYLCLPPFSDKPSPIHGLRTVTRVMAGGFFWLILSTLAGDPFYLVPYILCMAAHTANIVTARLVSVRTYYSAARVLVQACLTSSIVFAALMTIGCVLNGFPLLIVLLVPVAVTASAASFYIVWPAADYYGKRFRALIAEAAIAVIASAPAALFAEHVG